MPNYGKVFGYAKSLAEIAKIGEVSGWDGFFIFDHILADKPTKYPMLDPWVGLSAVATNTERIRIGTTVTPIPRRRPWKLARETVSLDQLSEGRLVLSVGLGFPPELEFGAFGEDTKDVIRAEKLDEGLDILFGLWTGKQFSYKGKHYEIDDVKFLPKPFQTPRITVWGAGFWPHKNPFIRAAKLDGIFPLSTRAYGTLKSEDYEKIRAFIFKYRKLNTPYDMVKLERMSGKDPIKFKTEIEEYEAVGITWLMQYLGAASKFDQVREKIEKGPPIKK